ncbi:PREDICTED: zinc finger CCCH-type with G patch domain-containing protein isoform X2 [Habropoda laboriosa]|uniref:zinc finger CCCH-type with G patch domain-containing protein isoform X2 n=1 Tax=Habropoda laboriosa TaxID=597456 RepID=UPI00083DE07F|nr:PREDICTED: zinc finger CCCH-type with G patch domain-containing protein isoform X2 [Habropoda laboriosa]
MTYSGSLKEAIAQYEQQLAQVQTTLSVTTQEADRNNLLSLQSDIQELIALTKESLEGVESADDDLDEYNDIDIYHDDPLAKEYTLFKAELEKSTNDSENNEQDKQDDRASNHIEAELEKSINDSENNEQDKQDDRASNHIEDQLKQLEGMKCRAPCSTGRSWEPVAYHNAMISSVYQNDSTKIQNMEDIKVRVLFLNPTHKAMLPCPHYLDGKCIYSDKDCKFSHGELVPLSSIYEYREPDFQSIKKGSRVLVKQENQLWHESSILRMPDNEEDTYIITTREIGGAAEALLQNILPLDDADLKTSDTSDDNDSETDLVQYSKEEVIHKPLPTVETNAPLGNWEKHTRGMGSKLMAQMGYVIGTGLGKHSDGRIEPVEATVLPAGKSLDHCMELRENANGDKNLFTVERRKLKQPQKLGQQSEKRHQKANKRAEKDVFNFINAMLDNKPKTESQIDIFKSLSNFRSKSNLALNARNCVVGVHIVRLERESTHLEKLLTRLVKGTVHYNHIMSKYSWKLSVLQVLRNIEKRIDVEQYRRKNKAKLTIF